MSSFIAQSAAAIIASIQELGQSAIGSLDRPEEGAPDAMIAAATATEADVKAAGEQIAAAMDEVLTSVAGRVSSVRLVAKDAAMERVMALVSSGGITLEDIAARLGATLPAAKDKPAKAPATVKYQHPDSGETWTGRGPTPKWLKALLDAGGKLDDYLVVKKSTPAQAASPAVKQEDHGSAIAAIAAAAAVTDGSDSDIGDTASFDAGAGLDDIGAGAGAGAATDDDIGEMLSGLQETGAANDAASQLVA